MVGGFWVGALDVGEGEGFAVVEGLLLVVGEDDVDFGTLVDGAGGFCVVGVELVDGVVGFEVDETGALVVGAGGFCVVGAVCAACSR